MFVNKTVDGVLEGGCSMTLLQESVGGVRISL